MPQCADTYSNLAAALQRRGLKSGDTALVQLGNVAEFYLTLFALFLVVKLVQCACGGGDRRGASVAKQPLP